MLPLLGSDHFQDPAESNSASMLGKLSQGQIDCLLLASQNYNSKEIAVRLGISHHTVDQRCRIALERLGVDSRREAARLVASAVGGPAEIYQRLIHQTPDIDAGEANGHQEGAVGTKIRHADRAGKIEPSGVQTEQRSGGSWSSLQLPFATRSHPSNEMSVGLRLLWIILIAIGAAFSAGMYLAGLESLSRMIGS